MEDLESTYGSVGVDVEASRSRWRIAAWFGSALAVGAAGSIGVVMVGDAVASSSPPTPAVALAAAAESTSAANSAHVTYGGSIQKDGVSYEVSGTGDVELGGEVASITTAYASAASGSTDASFMRDPTTIFEGGEAVTPALMAGPSWLALPVSSLPFLSPATSASFAIPTGALTILSLDKGITVTQRWSSGTASSEATWYKATLAPSTLETALIDASIPPAAEQQALSLAHAGDVAILAKVDHEGKISKITLDGSVTADGTPFVLHLVEKLSSFGESVTPTYPSGSSVCTADAWSLTTCAPGATP